MADETGRWVEAASRGDAQAVEHLLASFLPELRRYLDRNVGPLVAAKESSSDLAQSVCRELLEHMGRERFSYRGEAEFKQWLYNAATFKIRARQRFYLAAMRDAGRDEFASGANADSRSGADVRLADRSSASPSRAAELDEEVQRVRAALARLPERHREVIVLTYVQGLSHKQIAEQLGLTEANSRALLSRALARLATLGIQGE
jgi:RNA polymerase sigma-70 factor (ECF subfamily)